MCGGGGAEMGFSNVHFPETTAAKDVDLEALVAAGRVRAARGSYPQ